MTIEMPSFKEKSSTSEPSKSSCDPSALGTAANIANLPSDGGGGGEGIVACCGFIGSNITAGILFPPYGLVLLGGIAVSALCCCGYAAYRRVRKNVYVPKEEDPQFIGIQYTGIE